MKQSHPPNRSKGRSGNVREGRAMPETCRLVVHSNEHHVTHDSMTLNDQTIEFRFKADSFGTRLSTAKYSGTSDH